MSARAKWLPRSFFQRDPLICARELIGCELVWNDCAGIIVETEAYAAIGDEAAHTFVRPTARAFVATHPPGTAYVYLNYGMYWLLNVLVKGGSSDGFVLFRAIQPTRGVELMQQRRSVARKKLIEKVTALCSGPGKLTVALGVDGHDHTRDLCTGEVVGFRQAPAPVEVESDVRIGITKAADLPWRFLARGSSFLSVRRRLS
ncbi:MAG TPA: DNA-3-methyladenine glycosylase [Chthoniobacteraceae bacterium]|jgi:DNA-3-methyladenine glycosylase